MKRCLVWLFLGAMAFAQRSTTNITANNQCAQIGVAANSSSTVTIQVSGTWTATLQPQVAIAGRAATNTQVAPKGSTTLQGTITANGVFSGDAAGVELFQVCTTAYTSGTAVIDLTVTTGIATNLLGGGGTGAVSSVFGRTGAVTATSGDYTAAQVTNAVAKNASNVFTSGLQDFSAVTVELPEAAGFTPNVDSNIGYDLTANNWLVWGNGVANVNVVVPFSVAVADEHCVDWSVVGTVITVDDAGAQGTANCNPVTSVFGRTGVVAATSGDYTLDKIAGAAAAATLTESAVSRPITFAGVETANLTYPYVFQNTNSTNSNTSGALLVNCAGTDTGPTCFMVNGPAVTGTLASFVTGGTVTNGVISGQTQVWGITGQGAVTEANSFTVSAGVVTVPAGSTTASLAFAGDTAGAGFYRAGSAVYGITNGTNEVLRLQATGIKGTSGGGYGFTASSSSSTGAFDTCQSRSAAGVLLANSDSACGNGLGSYKAQAYLTNTNCSSSASPAVCAAAAAGSVAVPTGTNPTLVVNTTAVTANSQIFVQSDDSLGTKLSVTCNTTLANLAVEPVVSARTAATSFTITISGTVVTNPICLSYFIVN